MSDLFLWTKTASKDFVVDQLKSLFEANQEMQEKIEKLEEENRRLKEYIKDCYIQEYAGARYSCKHCTRLEDQGHYSYCPIVRFGLEDGSPLSVEVD